MQTSTHTVFWSKFATFLGTGVPLVTALEVIASDPAFDAAFAAVIREVIAALNVGASLGDALARHPETFGPDVVALVRDGESRGVLDRTAQTLAEGGVGGGAPEALGEAAGPLPDADDDRAALLEMIRAAAEAKATAVHMDARLDHAVVRFRVDGLLRAHVRLASEQHQRWMAALKVMARLDVAEQRRPQDGRIVVRLKDDSEELDLRVSVGPAMGGESAVVRVYRTGATQRVLQELDRIFPDAELRDALVQRATQSHGLFLCTGPTGSGKTTSAYALMAQHDPETRKVMTVEDPVELRLPGVHQVSLRPSMGLSYPAALRHMLRMDPDVMFCAEIRDPETAAILVRAALTGHVVFSQLHTRDPGEAIMRLLHIGIAPYLLADTLLGLTNQRLVRNLCPHCAAPDDAHTAESVRLAGGALDDHDGAALKAPVGCDACGHTGYRGRSALYTFWPMTPRLRAAILAPEPTLADLRAAAREGGAQTLMERGMAAVRAGKTTVSEVLRVVGADAG